MIALREDQQLSADELLAFSRERIAGYKQPRLIRFVAALPLTASGKVHRRAVIEQLSQP
jgi:acyl-CoA synthetase (AMP-forming)/AMP-acid ligase II